MTGHRGGRPRGGVRASSARRSRRSRRRGKLRGVLLQYPPRFKKSQRGARGARGGRAAARPARPARRVPAPLVGRGGRARRHVLVPRARTASPTSRSTRRGRGASNVMPRIAAATHPVAYVRFHGRNWRTWNLKGKTSAERFDWMYDREELEEWVEPLAELASRSEEVYAMFNNNRYDYAPRSAQAPARAARRARAPGHRRASSPPADRPASVGDVDVLAVIHGTNARGGIFAETVARPRPRATRSGASRGARRRRARSTTTARCSSSAARCTPTRTTSTPGSIEENCFIQGLLDRQRADARRLPRHPADREGRGRRGLRRCPTAPRSAGSRSS